MFDLIEVNQVELLLMILIHYQISMMIHYLIDLINMMDLINQFFDHQLLKMNLENLENYINHIFDNNIHISISINKINK